MFWKNSQTSSQTEKSSAPATTTIVSEKSTQPTEESQRPVSVHSSRRSSAEFSSIDPPHKAYIREEQRRRQQPPPRPLTIPSPTTSSYPTSPLSANQYEKTGRLDLDLEAHAGNPMHLPSNGPQPDLDEPHLYEIMPPRKRPSFLRRHCFLVSLAVVAALVITIITVVITQNSKRNIYAGGIGNSLVPLSSGGFGLSIDFGTSFTPINPQTPTPTPTPTPSTA